MLGSYDKWYLCCKLWGCWDIHFHWTGRFVFVLTSLRWRILNCLDTKSLKGHLVQSSHLQEPEMQLSNKAKLLYVRPWILSWHCKKKRNLCLSLINLVHLSLWPPKLSKRVHVWARPSAQSSWFPYRAGQWAPLLLSLPKLKLLALTVYISPPAPGTGPNNPSFAW